MTLSERLAEARRQRLIAAGELPPDEPATPAAPVVAETAEAERALHAPFEAIEYSPAGHLRVVDLRTDESPVAPGPAGTHASPGAIALPAPHVDDTVRCPRCDGPATVDMVDLVSHTTHYSCDRCCTMWYAASRSAQSAGLD